MFLFLVWCVFFLFLPQSSNWPSFGYTFVSHISFTLMFQWSGAVYSTFAGCFLFFFVSILYMLICKANRWTGFGVMGFYRKVVPNRKWSFICMGLEKILQSCGLVLYHKRKWFQGPCPISRFRWGRFPGTVSDVLHHQRVGVCFYTLVQVRLSDVKKIPYHSNNLKSTT